MSMKIGLLHDSVLPPKHYGGIERIVMALAQELTRLQHQVVIFSRKGSQIKDYENRFLPEDYMSGGLPKVLPSDLDFLHSHQPLGGKPPCPFVVTIHGN